jgi:hypothetical protein
MPLAKLKTLGILATRLRQATPKQKAGKPAKISKKQKPVQSAEGTGLEPATPCGAPHFQCGR